MLGALAEVGWTLGLLVLAAVVFAATRRAAVALHEASHAATAILLGFSPRVSLDPPSTHVPGATGGAEKIIRHAGWVSSAMFAGAATWWWAKSVSSGLLSLAPLGALWATALDGVASDLLGAVPPAAAASTFFCGNFGLLLLHAAHSDKVKKIIETMLRVTMMRGAQSAGLVTYQRAADGGAVGVRKRVVNGKRTDLCDLLMKKYKSELEAANIAAPALFQGHTRFATSSIANFEGCHPHQWSPAKPTAVWSADGEGRWKQRTTGAEAATVRAAGAA